MQPHRSRYWLNANPLDPEAFREQSGVVCDLYEQAGRLAEQGTYVVSTDEKTGMQALERKYPDLPMQRGTPVRREFEYIRHGVPCRAYSDSRLCTRPGPIATSGYRRSNAWIPVFSSVLTT